MSSGSKVVSLTAILALTSVARGAEINDDTDGQSSKSLEKEYQSYDANRYKAQQEQYHHNATRQRRIASNNKQRRLTNRRHRQQHTNKQQKQSHRQAQFASTSQRPQQPTTSPQSNTQTTSQSNTQTTTQLPAPKCGPTSGTYHSPYIGCYTDKLNDRVMSFELSGKYHSVLTCEKVCSDKGYRYIGREFKGQCFCHNLKNDIMKHGEESDCDCCGANVGGGKICVWEVRN
jgi:hypothetical protein